MTTPAIERVHTARQAVLSAFADAVADLEAGREAQALYHIHQLEIAAQEVRRWITVNTKATEHVIE